MDANKESQFAKAEQLLKLEMFPKAAQEMRAWPSSWIAGFYSAYPQYQEIIQQDFFADFWHSSCKKLHLKSVPDFHFVTQPGFSDAEFVLGYIFYLLALQSKQKKQEESYHSYIKKSLAFQSIHAHQHWYHHKLCTDKPMAEKLQHLAELLYSWEFFAHKQGTPGYLILANGYWQLVKLAHETKENSFENADYLFWKYLYLAKRCEPFCKAAIHNAYFGMGLELSNFFQAATINKIELAYKNYNTAFFNDVNRTRAEFEAEHLFSVLGERVKSAAWYLTVNKSQGQ